MFDQYAALGGGEEEGKNEKESNCTDKIPATLILGDSLRGLTCSLSLNGVFFSNL